MIRKENWPIRTIGEICDFESGNGFTPNEWDTKGIPIIRIQNLNGSRSFNYFNGTPERSWIVEPGDLLFAWAGVKGVSFGPTLWNGPRGVLNQHIYRIRPRNGTDLHWLNYALSAVTSSIEAKAHGFKTNLVHVRKSDITGAAIPYPPMDGQKKIATTITCWDSAIEKAERLVYAKTRRYQYELSRLITRAHCPPKHLGAFAKEVSERNKGGNEARVLSVSNSRGFTLPEEQFERRVASAELTNYKVVRRGQYAYNPSRINVGSIARLNDWDQGVLSPMYVVLGLDDLNVNSDYFMHWLQSREARQRIKNSAQGSVRETVSFGDFSNIVMPLPGIDRQALVAQYLNLVSVEIDKLTRYTEELKTQRRGLIRKLLFGQWRVRANRNRASS